MSVVDALAPICLRGSLCNPGTMATDAETRKIDKYCDQIDNGHILACRPRSPSFSWRTASLIERLESGVDSKIHDFANTIAEKVNRNKKWIENSDDKLEESTVKCHPEEPQRSPHASPVNINIPDEDLNALLGDLAELLNDETFDVQKTFSNATKRDENISKTLSNSEVVCNSTDNDSAFNDATSTQNETPVARTHKRKSTQRKKPSPPPVLSPLSPLISSDDRSQWAVPKEGYVTLLEAYPHLFGDELPGTDASLSNVGSETRNIDKCNNDVNKKTTDYLSEVPGPKSGKSSKKNVEKELRPRGRPKLCNTKMTKVDGLPRKLSVPVISQKKLALPQKRGDFVNLDHFGFGRPMYRPLTQPLRLNQITNLESISSTQNFFATPEGPRCMGVNLGSLGAYIKGNESSCCCCCCVRKRPISNPHRPVNALLTLKHVGYSSRKSQNESNKEANSSIPSSCERSQSEIADSAVEKTLRPIMPKTESLYTATIEPFPKSTQLYLSPLTYYNLSSTKMGNRKPIKRKKVQNSVTELNSAFNLPRSSFIPASPDSFSRDSALGTRSSIFSDIGKEFFTSTQKDHTDIPRELFGQDLLRKINNKKAKDYSLFYQKPKKDKNVQNEVCNSQMNFDLRIFPDLTIGDDVRVKSVQNSFRNSRSMKEFREIVCPPSCNCWNDGKEDDLNAEKDLEKFKMKNKLVTTRRIVPTPVLEPNNTDQQDKINDERQSVSVESESPISDEQNFTETLPSPQRQKALKRKRASFKEVGKENFGCDDGDHTENENSQFEDKIRSWRRSRSSSRRRSILCSSSSSENETQNNSPEISFSGSPGIKKPKLVFEKQESINVHSEDEAFCEEEFECQSPDLIDWIESQSGNKN